MISLNLILIYTYVSGVGLSDDDDNTTTSHGDGRPHGPMKTSTKFMKKKQQMDDHIRQHLIKQQQSKNVDPSQNQISGVQSFQQQQQSTNKNKKQHQEPVAVVAHVVSLIKCTKQASVTGFLDAAAVLRHSIHKQSIHDSSSNSKYSYQMYAIVHKSCSEHANVLQQLGYKILVKPSPVLVKEITPGWYHDHVEGENCCGSAEFIKLYAYTLTDHPIVVHWDMDVAILQPLDDLYDSMLYDKSTPEGQQARQNLLTQNQLQHPHQTLPDSIDAFFTRDITSSQPWEYHQGVQGGFLVAKPSMEHFNMYIEFIKEGNYSKGRGNNYGWGNLGYGGFQGAMAYQGVVAYFYDIVLPTKTGTIKKLLPNIQESTSSTIASISTAVELNACIWNQVVADVIWRGPLHKEHLGQCRQHPRMEIGDTYETNTPENKKCTDCRIVPIEQIKTVHYTACKKPWECSLPTPRTPKDKTQIYRLSHLTNVTTCGLLFRKWFDLRGELEDLLSYHVNENIMKMTKTQTGGGNTNITIYKPSERGTEDYTGNRVGYKSEYFGGYCTGPGKYIPMNPPPDDFNIETIYH